MQHPAVARALVVGALMTGALTLPAMAGAATPPPGRAYELVSPVQKSGSAVEGVAAAGHDAVAFESIGAFPGASSNITSGYVAHRTATGWVTSPVTPPTTGRIPVTQDEFYLDAVSSDFTKAIVDTAYPSVDPADQADQPPFEWGYADLFGWDGDNASWSWLTPGTPLPETTGAEVAFEGATPDLDHVVFATTKAVDPAIGATAQKQLYERSGGVTRIVSLDPDGNPLSFGASLGTAHNISPGAIVQVNGGTRASALSDDGQTVVFADQNGGAQHQLYVRTHVMDPARAATTEISASQATATAGQDCTGLPFFLAASRDGRRVYFECDTQLTDDAPSSGGVYAYDVPTGALHLTAPVSTGTPYPALLAADAGARHVYFFDLAALAPGAVVNSPNLYMIEDGRLSLVHDLDGDDPSSLVANGGAASADGTKLAFTTTSPIDPRANGHREVYMYDATSGALTCASCPPDGSASQGAAALRELGTDAFRVSTGLAPFGNVTDDGDVFFTSADALVPQDVNGQPDAYEVHGGRAHLLSSGTDRYPSAFHGASPDGTDVFIMTQEDLAPQDIDHGIADVYDVRLGGGFPVADHPRACQGEECQGPAPGAPPTPDPVSDRISGHGDAAPVPRPDFARRAISATARKQLAAGRTVAIRVKVNQAGTVSVLMRSKIGRSTLTVARGSKKATKASTVSVPVRLSSTARRRLNAGRTLRVTLSVGFTGVRAADATTLSLKKTKTSKGR